MTMRSLASNARIRAALALAFLTAAGMLASPSESRAEGPIPAFDRLLAHRVALKPELAGVHPRVFVTAAELAALRIRARTTHKAEWDRALATLVSLKQAPPPPPG
ncbi:MAG: hypothetical protein EHM24_27335, partial [Acidobacteria bacterium]